MKKDKIDDFIILGGGCSGLSFINQIIEKEIKSYSFIVIEKKKKYSDDKSWCFWEKNNKKLDKVTERSWDSFSFNLKGKTNFLKSPNYKYYYIRSIDFYKSIIDKISRSSHISLKLGETTKDIIKYKNYYKVITNKNIYFSKYILDTRPNLNVFKKKPFMYQSFVGYEIKTLEKTAFKKNNAYLMHNMQVNSDNFYFEYVLPLKTNYYLFELTTFSTKKVTFDVIEKKLKIALSVYLNNSYKVIRKECGLIPMGFVDKKLIKNYKNYYVSGSLAGAIRPSSGYAFMDIQKWANKSTDNLRNYGNLKIVNKSEYIKQYLDKVFLTAISNNIKMTPKIFYHFSKNIMPNTFIRFMLGKANIIDYIKVVYSMPKKVFLKCLIKN